MPWAHGIFFGKIDLPENDIMDQAHYWHNHEDYK